MENRKRKSESSQTPSSSKRRSEVVLLIQSLKCSTCSKDFQVEAISNLKAECSECLTKKTEDICGYSFELDGNENQITQNFQCPICLLVMRDATELPCNHLMCAGCLVKNEEKIPALRYDRSFLIRIYLEFFQQETLLTHFFFCQPSIKFT